jgi:hypothetical protein
LQPQDDLQTVYDRYALDAARTSDVVITVPATYTYYQKLTLRNGPTNYWITLQSDHVFDPKVRVSPADAGNMPKLIATTSDNALSTDITVPPVGHQGAAHHVKFVGFEMTASSMFNWTLVLIGTTQETDVADLPHDISFVNCYIHGNDAGGEMMHGIMFAGGHMSVVSSYLSGWKATVKEANAIAIANGSDGYLIENNYLEAAGENLIFDGDGEFIPNLVPSNIVIKHNYLYKPPAWRTLQPQPPMIKNLLEFKNGIHITIDSNVLENTWVANQDGTAVLFTVRTSYGAYPQNVVSDVHFTNNVVRHAANGVAMQAYDYLASPMPATSLVRSGDYYIDGNLFDDLSANKYNPGGEVICIGIAGPPSNTNLTNNTCQYAAGETRQPIGMNLGGVTLLNGITASNNIWNTEVGGDSRYGPGIFGWQPSPTDPLLAYEPPLSAPGVFAASNVVTETNPTTQANWQNAVPGILFAPTATSGAHLVALGGMETLVKAGIEQ